MRAHAITTPRTARYYTLGEVALAAEVWVVLHGYGQPAARFLAAFEGIAAPRRLVVAPEALSRFYLDGAGRPHRHVGASWMTREDRAAEIADYVAYLDGVYDAVAGYDEGVRLVVLGFSQGAATAARWLALSPRLAARRPRADRLVLWGADLPHDLDPGSSPGQALGATRPWLTDVDLTLVVGDADEYAPPEQVAATEERLRAADVPYRLVGYPGGHRIEEDVLKQLVDG